MLQVIVTLSLLKFSLHIHKARDRLRATSPIAFHMHLLEGRFQLDSFENIHWWILLKTLTSSIVTIERNSSHAILCQTESIKLSVAINSLVKMLAL